MKHAWLLLACIACSSSSQRTEQPRPPADAAITADAGLLADAGPPADAFVTMLIPPDASAANVGRIVVTDSDDGCGGMIFLDYVYFQSGS